MKKHLCQYAIVRFLPYRETGEFANVGIVLMCPKTGFFDFRLLTKVRRITAFFEELDAGIYRGARNDFKKELVRIQDFLAPKTDTRGFADTELARHLFAELTRPREVMMRFEGVRVVLADDPAQELDTLFAHYVERNFSTKAYQEKLLEKTVHKVLQGAHLNKQYKPQTIGNAATYHARFPFVNTQDGKVLRAIKPLHLAQDDPAQIFDHGWAWVGKIEKLRALHLLPERVMFPVQGPAEQKGERFDTFQEITHKLADEGVVVVAATQVNKIIEFATVH